MMQKLYFMDMERRKHQQQSMNNPNDIAIVLFIILKTR